MEKRMLRFVVGLSVFVICSLVYVFAYAGSNTVARTSARARLDINVCGLQTPLTPGVVRVWNTVFYPLRYLEAALVPDESIAGELVPPPYPSQCVFIKRDLDAKLYCLRTDARRPVKLDSFHFGQKVIAETGTALNDDLNPACLSRGSTGGLGYVKSLRPAP